jgi:threonine dehydrogenase-like Zn-dependent dehydrogenase
MTDLFTIAADRVHRVPDLIDQARDALGGPADVVFDCVRASSPWGRPTGLVTKGGRIIVVGVGAAGPLSRSASTWYRTGRSASKAP